MKIVRGLKKLKVEIPQHTTDSGQLAEKLSRVITVHEFYITEEDHEIYAARPIYDWQKSEAGQFVLEHAVEQPIFHNQLDVETYSHKYIVRARLYEEDITFYQLKWGNK